MLQCSKYHGLGNDFIVVDLRNQRHIAELVQSPEVVRKLCDRRVGIGGDGVLAILPSLSAGAEVHMRVLNADGSEAEMCGNGIRCVIKYLFEREPNLGIGTKSITVDTGAGPLHCQACTEGGVVSSVTVNMGAPRLLRGKIPMTGPAGERCIRVPLRIANQDLELSAVSMGNPHAVVFVGEQGPDLRALAESVGPAIEAHSWFPERTNAEFARVLSATEIELVVWERGCGITQACGTGACATAVAAVLHGHASTGSKIRVNLPGGSLAITVAENFESVFMHGPAVHVFDATAPLPCAGF